MPIYDIFTEQSLGFSHSCEVKCAGSGEVELTEEEVQQLVKLIRDNNGETNINVLGLKDKYPELYKKLDDAFREVAAKAEYDHWVIEGYENGWYDVDTEEMIAKCEEKYGFKFEPDPDDDIDDEIDPEDAKSEAFDEWVEEYRGTLSSEDEIAFLSDVFCLEPDVDDVEYDVAIPPAIVKMAR